MRAEKHIQQLIVNFHDWASFADTVNICACRQNLHLNEWVVYDGRVQRKCKALTI
jgi:hypothetical protein